MKKLILTAIILASSFSYSQEALKKEMSEEEKTYAMMCGNIAQAAAAADHSASDISADDVKELISTRQPVLSILRQGKIGIDAIIKDGDKNDTGGFGLILACGLVEQMASQIAEKGCIDISTNEVVKDTAGGIAICKELNKKLNP